MQRTINTYRGTTSIAGKADHSGTAARGRIYLPAVTGEPGASYWIKLVQRATHRMYSPKNPRRLSPPGGSLGKALFGYLFPVIVFSVYYITQISIRQYLFYGSRRQFAAEP